MGGEGQRRKGGGADEEGEDRGGHGGEGQMRKGGTEEDTEGRGR